MLVAIFAVVLVALAAFAIDVSRLYVGTNELQTGADAAALRGALHMQYNADQNPSDSIIAFASANQALDQAVTISSGDIRAAIWTPGVGPDTTAAVTWETANAVQVTVAKPTGLLFGKLLSTVTPLPRRRAIAWIANINRVVCPTPWGFPMSAINNALYGTNDYTVRSSMFDSLTAKLQNPGPLSVTMIFYPSDEPSPTAVNESWPFEAIDDNNVNMNAYADQLANASDCDASSSIAIDSAEAFPGKGGGSIPQKTVSGAFGAGITGGESLCEPNDVVKKGAPAADCYPVGSKGLGPVGVTVITSFISEVSGKSANVVSLGGFRVMCVFTGKPGGKPGEISNDPSETCAWYDAYRKSAYAPSGLPVSLGQGTVVGYPVTTFASLSDGSTLGNAPSLAQRLVLVR